METSIKLPLGGKLLVALDSVGNVAQLAGDVLVQSLQLKRVGYFSHPSLLAYAAADPNGPGFLASMELYANADRTLFLVQQRAPVEPHGREQFRADLVTWLAGTKSERIVLLAGVDATQRIDCQLHGTPMRRLAATAPDARTQAVFPALEPRDDPTVPGGIFVPGGGLARSLLAAAQQAGLPVELLSCFAYRGENTSAAMQFAAALCEGLGLLAPGQTLTPPEAWRLLFGSPPDPSLY
eukprot:m.234696 g.234696  ORF g.234696 m.234696 type:complete len:238 (+) comp19725_c0_seq1:41-754(+)